MLIMLKLHEALGTSSSHLTVSHHTSPNIQGLTSTTFQPPVNGFSSSVSTRVKTIAYRHESTASSDPTTASPVFAFRYKSSSWVANVTRNTGTLLSSILPELICGSAILRRDIELTYVNVFDIQDLRIGDQALLDVLAHCCPQHVEGLSISMQSRGQGKTYRLSTPLPQRFPVRTEIRINDLRNNIFSQFSSPPLQSEIRVNLLHRPYNLSSLILLKQSSNLCCNCT
jgi:hypothetical protein